MLLLKLYSVSTIQEFFQLKKKKDKTGHTEMHVALCYYDNIAFVSLFHTDFHFISATTRPTPQ